METGSMSIVTLPITFAHLLLAFGECFVDQRSFDNLFTITTGWIMCTSRHTVTRFIQVGHKPGGEKHHSALYRFFSRAKWDPDQMGRCLFELLLPLLSRVLEILVDDTLCRRSGPHLFGGAMHYDSGRSSYGRKGRKAKKIFSFGQVWVTLAVWVPLPWGRGRGIAVTVLWRLYRPVKQCREGEFRTRTELAAELLKLLYSWTPSGRKLYLIGDSEYACKTLGRTLPRGVHLIGPMPMNAAVYAPPGKYKGRGTRQFKRGERLPTPREIADFDDWKWTARTFRIYGKVVKILYKYEICLWYHVAGARQGKMVITRDPSGRLEDRAYFCTRAKDSVQLILTRFSHRWPLEQTYRDAKELLGLAEVQNGWWRRGPNEPAEPGKPGPNPHLERGSLAALRTCPVGFVVFGLICVWYLHRGNCKADVEAVRARSPWYLHKTCPSFADMLTAARRELWRETIQANPRWNLDSAELLELIYPLLEAA